MSDEQQEISKIELDAKNLVNNLRELHGQVGSYKTAKDELEKTNINLTGFIEKTQELAQESHRIIDVINKIGSGKIFKRLGEIEKNVKKNFIIMTIGFFIIVILQIITLLK